MFVLVVVELEAHAIMNLVILEGNMVLIDVVPLLDPDLLSSGTGLCRHELLEVADRVVVVALHSHFLSQTIVQHHLQHLQRNDCQTQTLDRKDFSSIGAITKRNWMEGELACLILYLLGISIAGLGPGLISALTRKRCRLLRYFYSL